MSTDPSNLGGRLRVLVVSQSLELSRRVRTYLSHEPWLESHVADCENTECARGRLEAEPFDLVVVDGGPDEVRALVEWATDAVLVAMPSSPPATDRDALFAAGATDCFLLCDYDSKPELLWNGLRQTLRYHAVRKQHRHLKQSLQDRARQIARLTNRIVRSSPYDSRTGWLSHAHTVDRCQEEIGRAVRYGLPLTLVLLEFFHLDSLEERYGEDVVDDVITQMSGRIRLISRHTDIAGHYGSESILLILPNTNDAGGSRFSQRIARALAAPIESHGETIGLEWCCAIVSRTGQCKTSPTDFLNSLEHRIDRAKESQFSGAIVAE